MNPSQSIASECRAYLRPCGQAAPIRVAAAPEPPGALDMIDERIQKAHETVSSLEIRLTRALRPEPASGYATSRDACPPTAREIAGSAAGLVDRLERLLHLIDL